MSTQVPLDPALRADSPAQDDLRDDRTMEVLPDLAYRRLAIVNVMLYGAAGAGDRNWVLIDAGVIGTKHLITSAARERFGESARPSAIVLTHGHFDHIGAIEDLASDWDVPVFAHPFEHPYLNGTASYPAPDPKVGGGLMSLLSPLFPRGPINLGSRLESLPADGSIPGMAGWRWIHTPGHSAGHVSFWRAADRTLIAGDAFITTRQESAYAAIVQQPEMHGPPMYYTADWASARESVARLARLEPELAVTGHGRAMRGQGMRDALHRLARDFDRVAVPKTGRYVEHPARVDDGTAYPQP